MATGRILLRNGDEVDPASNAPAAAALTASSASAPTNGQQIQFRARAFDKTTDEGWFWYIQLPSNYSSGGTVNFSWLTTVTSGNVIWKTGFVVVHPSSEGTPTDLDAAAIGTVTAASAVAAPGTAGYVKQTSIDVGVTGAHASDLLVVYLGRDADNASDTADADALFVMDATIFTYTTV